MNRRYGVLLGVMVATCATSHMQAQQAWQKQQMPSASEVHRAWNDVPPEYGPEPYYGLNGAVDHSVIERDLDTMKRLGYSAVTVQWGFNTPYAYLSPEYFTFFRTFVNEAKKRNMRVWIVDDSGYPSGFAGGKFTELKPELRMQALVAATKIPAHGGDHIQQPVGPNTVAVTATQNDTGKDIAVPLVNGAIDWKAPDGEWTLTVVEHQFRTSPTRSDTNPKRTKDGTQSLEDYLDPAATAQFLAFTHEQYKKTMGDEFGKTILGFRGDEPDYSIAGLPWTPKFFDRFQQTKGYDIHPFLASFLQPRGAKLTPEQTRARADYYDVFSQMFRDGFFKVQGDWCAANHLEYQVHLNHEEAEMELTRSEGEFFRDMRYVQVPGIDSIWHQIWTDTISDFPRLASSAAHVYGHPRAFTESFAAYRPEPDVTLARYILNEQFVRGVNLIETMYFPASSGGPRGGPAAYMRDPAYPELLSYVKRASYLLSMGRPAASVALFLPSSSMWMGDAAADTAFVSTERMLSERQIDFDIVDEDALASTLKAGRGWLETASGNRYGTIILPRPSVLSSAAVTRLKAFAASGGKVLFLGGTPSLIFDKSILDGRAATAADFTWATVEASAQLPATPTPPAQPPTTAPAPQVVPAVLEAAVAQSVPAHDVTLDAPDTTLRVLHRRLKDADVFFLFNESGEAFQHSLTLKATGKVFEVWNPQTGEVSPLTSSAGKISLSLAAYQTAVIVAR